ncbi:MAG: hypothetical protein U9O85_04215 [Euryarchaeota archaeon]|nr:hypothetical protein [Euryarchaeota archaeon]
MMKRKVVAEFLILILVISAILYLSFFPVEMPHHLGKEEVMSRWCGVLFIENLPDPHTTSERAQAQASLHLTFNENGSISYRYPFILDLMLYENFTPVNPCPGLSPQEGFLFLGDEKEVYGFELSFEKVETAPGVPIEGDWYRIVIIKEGIWGVIFSSDRCLFSMDADTQLEDDLNKGVISEGLKNEFKTKKEITLSQNAYLKKEKGNKWRISDGREIYIIKKEDKKLNIYSGYSLIIARRFGDNCIQFYLMPLDDLGGIAKKYNLSEKDVNSIDGNRAYLWDKKLLIL